MVCLLRLPSLFQRFKRRGGQSSSCTTLPNTTGCVLSREWPPAGIFRGREHAFTPQSALLWPQAEEKKAYNNIDVGGHRVGDLYKALLKSSLLAGT